MSPPTIAEFAPGDSGAAAALERVLFPRQDPWSEAQFRDTLGQEHVRMWSARTGERLVGYGVLGAFGPAGDREFEVFNIAVDPDFQGRGLGRALLAKMLAVADAESAPVLLEVATGNIVARTLYEAHGFSVVGLRRNYYRPSGEDAYAMVRSAVIGGSEPRPGEPTAVPEEA